MTQPLSFTLNFETGLVDLNRDLLINGTGLAGELFESAKVVNSIPLTTFFDILKSSMGDSYISPTLPFGTVFFQDTGSYFMLVQQVNPFPFIFRHSGHDALSGRTIVHPKAYFVYVIPSNLLLEKRKIFISKTHIFTEDSSLSYFDLDKKYKVSAFPNYSPTYGTGVCWGRNGDMPYQWSKDIVDIRTLESGPLKYVNSKFNNDLSPRFDSNNLTSVIQEELVRLDSVSEFLSFAKQIYSNSLGHLESADVYALRKKLDSSNLYYCFIIWFSEKYNEFPNVIINVLNSHDSSFSTMTKNPLRGY
jgi:hypothetical protein